ncbi:MAG: JAB domain-containing protein [Desulfobacterales bacterium]
MTEKARFWEDLKSGRFLSMVKESSKGRYVSNSREVFNVMKPVFAEQDDIESVYCIFLDAKNKILAIEKMFTGSITASIIYTRELIKRTLALKATALVLTHNHPSGCTNPSPEDKTITLKIGIALASIDVTLHDHIIIGDGHHSMADTGYLKKVRGRYENLLRLIE